MIPIRFATKATFPFLVSAAFLASPSASAEVRLSPLFTPDMVVQRDAPLKIHGTATAGETIRVSFADSGKSVEADKQGRWEVEFAPHSGAATPEKISVAGSNSIEVSPVWVGDVYIAAGGDAWAQRDGKPQAGGPPVSLFMVRQAASHLPATSVQGVWHGRGKLPPLALAIAEALAAKSKLPVGMIVIQAPSAIETWIPRALLEATPAAKPVIAYFNEKGWGTQVEKVEEDYGKRLEAWKKAGNEFPLEPEDAPTPEPPKGEVMEAPAVRFNAMFAPLAGLPVSGLVWAHGEDDSSVARAAQYGNLLPVAIRGFRENFGKPSLPVVIVQIGARRYGRYDDRAGAELREGQWKAGDAENTTTVVSYDLSGKNNPQAELAQRISAALAGGKHFPSLAEHKSAGASIRLEFKDTGSGLAADGGKVRGIAINDGGQRWVWADGVIEGDTLVVSAPGVTSPTAVRYAWQDLPVSGANLTGKNGLPVAPFRTDKSPPVTATVSRPGDEARHSLLGELYVEDPRLPRVVLVGDSIAIGQIESMRKVLAGKANVIHGNNHKGQGMYTSQGALKDDAMKHFLLERGPFDVVQFNMGVHEFGGAEDPAASAIPYAQRLREIVHVIRENNPGGKVIWVSSTGTRPDNKVRPLYLAGATAYNKAAAKVMAEEGVPISDLFGLTQPKVDEYIGSDNIHIRPEKRIEISEFLVKNILSALNQKK